MENKSKILIIDADETLRENFKYVLEKKGYEVQTAQDGIDGLEKLEGYTPNLIILDINMPGLDGLDVAKKVFENKLKTKVVLLTIHKEMTIYKKATEYNIYGYILKEHAHTELKKCLQEVEKGNHYVSRFLQDDLIIDVVNGNNELSKLTLSERKIVEFIAQQKTSKQIAELLFLSEKTVEGHRTNIIEKLGLPKEKNTLLKWAIQHVK